MFKIRLDFIVAAPLPCHPEMTSAPVG
jgi:hypothetical protein